MAKEKKEDSKEKKKKKNKKNSKKQEVKSITETKTKKNNGISPINRFNIIFADLQIIFIVLTVVFLVWYLFNPKLWHVLQFVLGITMFISGYNNKIIYNKPKFAYVYYFVGAVLIICDILLLLGV